MFSKKLSLASEYRRTIASVLLVAAGAAFAAPDFSTKSAEDSAEDKALQTQKIPEALTGVKLNVGPKVL